MKPSTLVKYCGNRSLHDLQVTAQSRADYLGLVFVPDSKRYADPIQAASWLRQVELAKRKKLVGLFVHASPAEILAVHEIVGLDIIQCHGNETVEQVKAITLASGLPVWKAIHHRDDAMDRMRSFSGTASGYVVDSKVKGQWGGTGHSFNWEAIPSYLAEAARQRVPCFIAGGINPENVSELLRFNPDGIDVSSGIENGNRKDRETIKRLEERLSLNDELS